MFAWLQSKWKPYVLNLELTGKINHSMVKKVDLVIQKAGLFHPKMIALSLNSGGGSVIQARKILSIVQEKAEQLKCPVYTFATDAALGSAFAILCGGSKSFVDPHSLIGGAGSSLKSLSLQGLVKQYQLQPVMIPSAQQKVRLSPFEDLKPEDEAWVKNLLAHLEQCQKNEIVALRPSLQSANLGDIALGKKAVQTGMADYIGDLHTVAETEFPGSKVVNLKASGADSLRSMSIHDLLINHNQAWELVEDSLNYRV